MAGWDCAHANTPQATITIADTLLFIQKIFPTLACAEEGALPVTIRMNRMTVVNALIAYTGAAGLLTVTPGLDTALVLRTSAVEGRGRAMLAGIGICLGCLLWGLAAALGIGALLAVSRIAYHMLRLAGACYLIVLGARMIWGARGQSTFARDGEDVGQRGASGTRPRWLTRGLFTNLLNPKVGVFYVTFLPQFVPAGVNVTGFSMILAGIHATEGILWFWLLTSATELFAKWLRRPRVTRTLDRTTGAVLMAFGAGLALERR